MKHGHSDKILKNEKNRSMLQKVEKHQFRVKTARKTHFFIFSGSILVLAISLASAQVRPPNFSPDAIPETSFTCEDKITGGYYADQEADCQLFHVCVQVSEYEVRRDFYHIEHGIDILRIFEI